MTWRLSFHPEVWDDADDAARHYGEVDPRLAGAFVSELGTAFRFIRQYPKGAPVFHAPYRRVALRRFPYLVCYRVMDDGGDVRVLMVVSARRDPQTIRSMLAQRT